MNLIINNYLIGIFFCVFKKRSFVSNTFILKTNISVIYTDDTQYYSSSVVLIL